MTRDQIVAEAARRLGDTSNAFLADVGSTFDLVLQDLAAAEAIGDLKQVSSASATVVDQRNYDTRTLTGLVAPYYPDRIYSLRVWSFGTEALLELVSDSAYELRRAVEGDTLRGRPRIWRVWPNARQVQVHPPADAAAAGQTIEVVYQAPPPAALAGPADIVDIRHEDLETIVYGLQARLAPFLDETLADAGTAWQLYLAGRDRMWGRRHNRGVTQVEPVDQ